MVQEGTSFGIFLKIIGSLKTVPPKIFLIVPLGDLHIFDNPNSFTLNSSGWFVDHVRAEFNQPSHTGGFVRNDQWRNIEKHTGPERPGITNIRGYPSEQAQGAQMRIATYLGSDCKGGNFSNSGGDYLINDITWP